MKNKAYAIILLFISPALSLLSNINEKDVDLRKSLYIALITVYGATITLREEVDGSRHFRRMLDYADMSLAEFITFSVDIVLLQSQKGIPEDLYLHLLSYIFGAIVLFPTGFFAMVAFVYAFFYVNSIYIILERIKKYEIEKSYVVILFITILILWKSIEGINTVRTWTAMWVMVYGSLMIYKTGRKRYLALLMLTPYIHFSYFLMALPALLIASTGIWKKNIFLIVLGLLFIFSLLPQYANIDLISQIEQTDSELADQKLRSYYREDAELSTLNLDRGDGLNFYRAYVLIGFHKASILLLSVYLVISRIYIKRFNSFEIYNFSIGILTYTLVNLLHNIYALYNRGTVIAGLFILISVVSYLSRLGFKYDRNNSLFTKIVFLIAGITLLPFIVYFLAVIIQYISIGMVIFPAGHFMFDELQISIREILGMIPFIPS